LPIAMPTTNFAAAIPALAKIEIAATEDLVSWGLSLIGGGLAGRPARLKRRTKPQPPLRGVAVANCSELKARNDAVSTEYNSAIPRRDAPEFFQNRSPNEIEGAGNAGCLLHPRSRVQTCTKKRTRAYRYRRSIPAFPAQWFYGLYRALPGDEFVFHRR